VNDEGAQSQEKNLEELRFPVKGTGKDRSQAGLFFARGTWGLFNKIQGFSEESFMLVGW
jgi:hypothetical protein